MTGDIKSKTRRKFTAAEKIRIMLKGMPEEANFNKKVASRMD